MADRVLVLAGGRLVAAGRPAEAVTATLLREVYGVRARVDLSSGTPLVVVEGSARAPSRPSRARRAGVGGARASP